MTNIAFSIFFLVTTFVGSLSLSEYHRNDPEKGFNLFDDDDDEGSEAETDSDELTTEEEESLLSFLEGSTPFQSLMGRSMESFGDVMNHELLDDSSDSEDEDPLIKILKYGYRFNRKLAKRSGTLDTVSKEFNKFVVDGFTISNHWFNLLSKLDGEEGVSHEFRETILNMMAQAERNIESIHKVTGMYKKTIIEAEDGLGKLESLPGQFNAIASLYDPEMDNVERSYPITYILDQLKGDVSITVEKEKNLLRLFRIFMEEQLNLITLGKKLWVTSQGHHRYYDDDEDSLDDLTGGLKRNPTNEDILKQILEVRRTRRAISAYSQFLERNNKNQNQTTTAKKTKKEEL